MGRGGGCCFFLTAWGGLLFFDNCEWGIAKFLWHLKISPAPPPPPPLPYIMNAALLRNLSLKKSIIT